MRDNSMVGLPPNSLTPEPLPSRPMVAGAGAAPMMLYSDTEIGFFKSILLSLMLHVAFVGLIALIFLILQFLGINLLSFDRPQLTRDIEFQLVDSPTEPPRNPHTKNRAEHNSRSGGEKIPNVHEAQSQRMAGQPKPQPKPRPMVAQAQPKPVQNQSQQRRPSPKQPQPQPKPVAVKPNNQQQQQQPAPPKPIAKAPKPSTNKMRIAAVPNPLAPIHVPSAPGPVADTGPVVRGPSGGGGSPSGSSGSSVGPATMPGQFAGSGRPSAGGGPAGQGGKGSYSQYGSPGGGGGKPGVDAIAEPDFGPYLAELQRRIRRNWQPPEDREDKTVVLLFTIAKDGRLLNIQVKRSSGYGNADAAAKAAVERSAPFRPLPAEYRNNSINVEFTFDYNVYTGKSGGISRH